MQRYLVDYTCYNSNWEVDERLNAIKTYNRYCFSRSSDEEAVRKAVNSHKDKGAVVLRAWVIEWNNPNAKYKLVIGDPATSPSDPGTIFLKRVRAENEKQLAKNSSSPSRDLIVISEERTRKMREARVQEKIDVMIKEEEEKKKPEYELYTPYPDPIAVG